MLSIVALFVFQVVEKDKAAGGDGGKLGGTEKRKAEDGEPNKDLKKVGAKALVNCNENYRQYQ
jgi:hypothetical protein